ncbi:protein kinase [Nannocystis sp.]|uniref:protein kinase domain-containing protein n=1 Tax=Nannocystis sp. TaxID=1962667 RepID=UPI002428C304|nr:protein kinase [Nannocystis sp.]MBK7829427.1 protein kinase [Nannocystis sp.]MBK9753451.1 protein kinase [Nannocystis sp.]
MVERGRDTGVILIVDDHEDTRVMLRDFLVGFGFHVDTAADGAEALVLLRARPFDLVLTDLNMPRLSGLELIAAIRSEQLTPDVLMLSADGQVARAVEAMRLGALNYLIKPPDLEVLLAELRAVMQARRDRAAETHAGETTAVLGHHSRPPREAASEAQPARVDESLPTTIGRYEVLGKLGAGGMGTIYKCFDPSLRRTVAVKVVANEADPAGRDELLRRFACEAQAAGMLHHPNIVTVFDYSAAADAPVYLAMEYLAGTPLGTIIAAGRMPWQRSVGIAFQLADALEFAHRNQVIHRDVKPGNVLVLPGDIAKILDFGIAKLANSELTVPGTFVGSPRYLAPESFRGARIDYRADQFSLGSVLYEMLAGHPAFDFTNFYAGVHHILSDQPTSLEALGVDAPLLLHDVVARLHQKDPDRRYHNEMRLLEDLGELAELAGLSRELGVPRDTPDYLR